MADTLYLEVITPERVIFRGEVSEITAPGAYGEFMVLPDHAPFFTSLEIGMVHFKTEQDDQWAAAHGGYFEVLDNRITVLADSAELAHEIDVERVRQAKARAEARLKEWENESRDNKDVVRAQSALLRAMAREKVMSKM